MLSLKEIFSHIYHQRLWGSEETVSGLGARLQETRALIQILPELMKILEVRSLLDIPCGDFNWMKEVDLRGIDYHGADIVPELVAVNQARYGRPGVQFYTLDLTHDDLPVCDLVLVRHCFVHLSYRQIFRCLKNLIRHPFHYVLLSTDTQVENNEDLASGLYRPLNLCRPPFNLPEPLKAIPEWNPGNVLGLWTHVSLAEALKSRF